MKLYTPQKNMSVLYLALACLLYYFIASGLLSSNTYIYNIEYTQYVELYKDGRSIMHVIDTSPVKDISDRYNIDIKNGDKIIIDEDGSIIKTGRISGIKSLSLGVPIGINSAPAKDLTTLPGIGSKTAERIITYRDNSGGFKTLEELDNVPGIGVKTMESLKGKISLD